MKYLNIEITTLRSPDYIGAEPVVRATWLNLLAYCADQENGGIIRGCRPWKDRQWQQVAGVTAEEVAAETMLWHWAGEDLCVSHYPTEAEQKMQAMREGGKRGGKRSGKARLRAKNEGGVQGEVQGEIEAPLERKEKKRKEIEKEYISQSHSTPTLEECKSAAELMGVEARLAEIFWNECEARPISPDGEWTGKDGTVMRNWRNALKAYGEKWKANEQRNHNGTAFARNGVSALSTKPLSVWEAKEKKNALQAELERMKSDRRWRQSKPETPWETEWSPEAREKVREIRAKITKLEEVIAA